ncbi:hypothetical protein V8C40DRAFT_287019 [Trichoderma camerunense]
MDESKLHERIRLAIDEFLASENTTTEAKEALLRYAEARPNRANPDPIIPTEEVNIRLELVAKLEKTNGTSTSVFRPYADEGFQFTLLQLSYLMLMPLECLRRFSQESCTLSHPYHCMDTFYISFKNCRPLETGDVFSLVMAKEEAAKMKVMIDIQWANAKLAAISGAADFWEPEPPAGYSSDPEVDRSDYVAAWRETLQHG